MRKIMRVALTMLIAAVWISNVLGAEAKKIQRHVINAAGGDVSSSTTKHQFNFGETINGYCSSSSHAIQSGYMVFVPPPTHTPTATATVTATATMTSTPTAGPESKPVRFGLRAYNTCINPMKGEKLKLVVGITKPGTRVCIKIYNLLGEHISTLTDKEYGPGEYDLTWAGENVRSAKVGSGIYVVRVCLGQKTEVLKVAVVK